MQVERLGGIEKFEGEIKNFILNTFINFKPVKIFENSSGVSEFRSFNNFTALYHEYLSDFLYKPFCTFRAYY